KGCEFTAAGFECVGSLVHGGNHISIDTRIKLELFAVSGPRMMPVSQVVKASAARSIQGAASCLCSMWSSSVVLPASALPRRNYF
ncbi:hypothetical protein ACCS78_39425, partial [Rhizobium johnstonii]